jgi:hypothetical protein
MEGHPAHAALPPTARAEALDVLTWAYTGLLIHTSLCVSLIGRQIACSQRIAHLRRRSALRNAKSSWA